MVIFNYSCQHLKKALFIQAYFKTPLIFVQSSRTFATTTRLLSTSLLKLAMMPVTGRDPRKRTSSTSGSQVKSIGTHDGKFHCDEILACFMLKLLPEYADMQIIRSANLNYIYYIILKRFLFN